MKEMFFLLTCTPAKLHSNGNRRLQQEIHLLSDSFWKKIFAFLVYLECNNKISASIHLSFFSIPNLFQTSPKPTSALPTWQPFLDGGGGKTAFRLTDCQRKEIFPCHLVRRWIYGVFQSGQSIQTSEKELTAPVGLNSCCPDLSPVQF